MQEQIYIDAIDKRIAAKINELRLAKGLSHSQIAVEMGVTHQQVSKYLRGKDRLTGGKIKRLAGILDISVSELFDEREPIQFERQRRALELQRHFVKLPFKMQHAFCNMVRIAAEGA